MQVPEEELQDSSNCTIIMSDSEEPQEEPSTLLVSKEQVPQQHSFDYVIALDSDEGSDNMEQWDSNGTQPDDENVNDESFSELTSTHDQPSTSHDDLLSTNSSAVDFAAVIISSGDFGNVVEHKFHLTDHQKLTFLKKPFIPTSDFKFPARVINGIQRHF